jgi:hypothetical protein
MGIELVKLVFANHRDLPGNSFKVLGFMALTALDKPNTKGQQPNLYWYGWENLALILGKPWGEPGSRERRSAEEAVRRALAPIVRSGAIARLNEARTGTRQCYSLRLWEKAVSPTESVGQDPTKKQGQEPHGFVGNSPSKREGPRTELGQRAGLTTGHTSTSQPSPKTARDESGAESDGVSERWTDERCDHGHLVRNDTCATCAEHRHDLSGITPRPVLRLIEGETA